MAETWILVADAARAVTLSCGKNLRDLHELRRDEYAARDRPADRMGSVAFGSHQQSLEPRSTPREHSEMEFARSLVDTLERGRTDHAFKNLVLVAPPRMLGRLRECMGEPLKRTVMKEVTRELAGESPTRLKEHLASLLD